MIRISLVVGEVDDFDLRNVCEDLVYLKFI